MSTESVDTPLEGPMTIDQILDAKELEAEQSEAKEEIPEPEEVTEAEDETPEGEEAEAETDDAEPEAEDEGPEVYSIEEYGGITLALEDGTQTTLSDLHKGTLRQADYTRKTTELANDRKAFEQEKAEFAAERQRLIEQASSFEEPEPDWVALAEEDPLGWQVQKLQWDQKQAKKAADKQAAEDEQKKQKAQFSRRTADLAIDVFPTWSDAGEFEKGMSARRQAALNAKFSEVDFSGIYDLRFHILLEKAARYDAGLEKKSVALKKIEKTPKVVKPGASVSKAEKEQAARAAKRKQRSKPMSMNDYLNTFEYDD